MRSSNGCGMRKRVRRGDEHHVRQVVIDLEIVIVEGRRSARDRALRATPRTDRRANRRRACRPRRAGTAGSTISPFSCPAGPCPASSRYRSADGRGSRPRRARRPATCARNCGRWRARPTCRARSCRRPAAPTRHRIGPFIFFMRCCTARYSRMRSLTFSSPKWSALSTFSAPLMSRLILVRFCHGTDSSQSR